MSRHRVIHLSMIGFAGYAAGLAVGGAYAIALLVLLAAFVLLLTSLDRLRRDLAQVRAGTRDRLALPEVSELRPLTVEINEALDQNADLRR